VKFAHFEFDPEQDRLGEGPQSEVFRAVDTRLGRTVALKVLRPHVELDPAAAQRFDREAKHTSSLEHKNIGTIYEYDKWRGTSYIAMEYMEGRTLDKIVKDGPISFEEGVRIGRQVTAALALVHERGLVHRDLKPANIMVLEDGTVKLLDFGICRSGNEAGITQSGMLVGTVLYMAPEQVRGEEVTPRTDVFALGSVLYHATTGSLPFPGRSFPEVCMAILDGTPLLPSEQRSGFPQPLEGFLLRCLGRDPRERWANGAAAHGALLSVAETMRLSTGLVKSASVKGRVLITPLIVRDGNDHANQFAGSLRRDLSSELSRSTQLRITLLENEQLPDNGENGTYVMRGRLELDGPRGVLDYVIERANGAKLDDTSELWRDRVEAVDEDEWGLQAQLVGTVARAVKRKLADFALAPSNHVVRRDPQAATAFCFHAHEVLHKGTTKHLLAAVSSFRRAVEADSNCALAYAGLGESHVRKFLYWDGDVSFLEEAEQYARRAIALDPTCAEAHTSLGFAFSVGGRRRDAQREYRLALQIDNDEWLAHRLLGALLARDGNHKGASPLLRRAIALRPSHIGSYDHLYEVLCSLDRYEEALEIADRGIQAARRNLSRVPDDQDARLHLALLLARMGSRDEALAEVARARELAPKDGFTAFHIACVHSLLGDVETGLAALLEAQARGYYVQSELTRNTDLDALRGREEFQQLLT
jgi:serine/threonine protein kinase/tetratricopeptide (TPR) repeat protein